MLIGLGGSDSSAGVGGLPSLSNTQSVEISTTCASMALAAATTLRVAPTYASQARRRSVWSAAGSFQIAACTIASGRVASTERRTTNSSVRSTCSWPGATTSAPCSRANTYARFEPTNPLAPVR